MKNKKNLIIGLLLAIIALAIVFITEQYIQPGYFYKSVIKVISFLGAILVYSLIAKKKFMEVIKLRKTKNLKPVLIVMGVFLLGTLAVILLCKNYLDLAKIKESLVTKEHLTKQNCLFIFAYIILCNSFLEESFFRGFVYQLFTDKKVGRIVSSLLFSLYHIGIFISWFSSFIFALCLFGLAAVGYFLQILTEKYNSIVVSYITHGCANIAINIVGFLLIFELI